MSYPQMPPFTQNEIKSFLKQPLIAKFYSFNEDGTIFATPVYYKHENGLFGWLLKISAIRSEMLSATTK